MAFSGSLAMVAPSGAGTALSCVAGEVDSVVSGVTVSFSVSLSGEEDEPASSAGSVSITEYQQGVPSGERPNARVHLHKRRTHTWHHMKHKHIRVRRGRYLQPAFPTRPTWRS